LHVLSCSNHPFGLGIFEMGSLLQKDKLISAQNFRELNYRRKGWILLLGFRVTLMNYMCIHQVVASFGKLLRWHNSPRIMSYVLVKC
ncbi:hypothetical protein ACJX0J_036816, partial [Zea mays]